MLNTYESFMKNCCDWGMAQKMENAQKATLFSMQAISDAFTHVIEEQMDLVQKSIKKNTEHLMNHNKGNNPIEYALEVFHDLDHTIKKMSEIRADLSNEMLAIYKAHAFNPFKRDHNENCNINENPKEKK
jgi:hypothetical protein